MQLAGDKIKSLTKKLKKQNLRIVIMGRPEPVDPDLWSKMMQAEQETMNNTCMTVCICFNYGGEL